MKRHQALLQHVFVPPAMSPNPGRNEIALPSGFAEFTMPDKWLANKKVVIEFLNLAINQKDFDAAAKFLGPRYVQHKPHAADGPEGLKAYIDFLRKKFPNYYGDTKRVTITASSTLVSSTLTFRCQPLVHECVAHDAAR
jgi:predicted SnoaL-like aldol condensation-catalyzing enzyme